MNASDIVKAKQNRVLYQAYYRPTIFPGSTINGTNVFITSSITYCPISTVSSGITDEFISSFVSCITTNYSYKCEQPNISYNLLNDINQGKYLCGFPYCSSIVEWNTKKSFITGVCDCKISFLTWKNTTVAPVYQFSTATYSSVIITSSLIASGPSPIICPLVNYYQGTNFDNRCSNCTTNNYGNNACCGDCASGQ
jgi:hypothetical protein